MNFGGTPQMGMGGYYYNSQPVQQQPKVMNVLTDDEIKQLQQTSNQFSLGLTQKEALQAACNHRVADGSRDSLVIDNLTGTVRCTICGYEFRPVDENSDPNDIKDAADRIIDILQTIKLLYTDLPATAAREYFQIIPLIAKVPQLFEFAAKNFNKHEFNAWQYNNQNMGGIAMLQNLGNMFGQQPFMNAPVMGQQSGMAPGYPTAPMMGQPAPFDPSTQQANPFGFAGASQPVNQGYMYQPTQQAAPVTPTVTAPAAPAQAEAAPTETVTDVVNV